MAGGTNPDRWENVGELTIGSISVNNLKGDDLSHSGSLVEDSAEDDAFGRTHCHVNEKKSDVTFRFRDVAAAISIKTLYWDTGTAVGASYKKYKARNGGSAADKTVTFASGQLHVVSVRIPGENNNLTMCEVECAIQSDSDGDGDGVTYS